ncbi:MAG: hypothetical protein N3F03_00585 [Ignavibacteria bacterium]|nr:hypothetical protein [Ignavibacteria bacterium]
MGIKPRDIIVFLFIWIGLFFTGAYLYFNYNFYAQEGIFLMEKAQLAMRGNPPRLENLGLIYPPLPYLFYLPLAVSSSPIASLIISTFWGALVIALCIRYLRWIPGNTLVKLLITSLMIVNPVFLYVIFAQPSQTLYVLFFVVFVYSFFRFHETRIPYYIVLSGVALGAMSGIRYDTFFLTLALIPFAPFLISETIEFNVVRIFALTLMLVLPTFIVLGSWVYLNWIFAGEPFYFYFSPYSYFKQVSKEMALRPELAQGKGNLMWAIWIVLKMSFLTYPAYYFTLPTIRTITIFVAAFAPIILQIIVIFLGISALSYSWFGVLIPLSIIIMYYFINSPLYRPVYAYVVIVIMAISVYFGYQSLANSVELTEKNFATVLKGEKVKDIFEEELQVAKFLKENTTEKDMILIDDAVGYPIVCFFSSPKQFYLPYQYDYVRVLQQPQFAATYIVVPRPELTVTGFDQLTAMYPDAFEKGFDFTTLVYQTPNWRVYKSQTQQQQIPIEEQ